MDEFLSLRFLSNEMCETLDAVSWNGELELVGQICANDSQVYVTKWQEFEKLMTVEFFSNIKCFKREQHKLISLMKRKITGNSVFQEFQNMSAQAIHKAISQYFGSAGTNRTRELPQKDLYVKQNVGKYFIAVDLRKANYNAMRLIDETLVFQTKTWEELLQKFSKKQLFQHSKTMRQKLFGQVSAQKIETIQAEMIYSIYDIMRSKERYVQDCIVSYLFFSKDELLIGFEREIQWKQVLNFAEQTLEHFRDLIELYAFKLETKSIQNTEFYIRNSYGGERIVKCISADHKLSAIKNTTLNPNNDLIVWTFDSFSFLKKDTLVNARKRMISLRKEMPDVRISLDTETKKWTISGKEPKRLLKVKDILMVEMIDTVYKRFSIRRDLCFIGSVKSVQLVDTTACNTFVGDVYSHDRYLIRKAPDSSPSKSIPKSTFRVAWNKSVVMMPDQLENYLIEEAEKLFGRLSNIQTHLNFGTLTVKRKYDRFILWKHDTIESCSLPDWLTQNQLNTTLEFNSQNFSQKMIASIQAIILNELNAQFVPKYYNPGIYHLAVLDISTQLQLHFDIVVGDRLTDFPHLSSTSLLRQKTVNSTKTVDFDVSNLDPQGIYMDTRVKCEVRSDEVLITTEDPDFKLLLSSLVFNHDTGMFQLTTQPNYEQTHLTYTNDQKRFFIKKASPWDMGSQYVFKYKDRRYFLHIHGSITLYFYEGMSELPDVPIDPYFDQDFKRDLKDMFECKDYIVSLMNRM